jgi:hypothetical protein
MAAAAFFMIKTELVIQQQKKGPETRRLVFTTKLEQK